MDELLCEESTVGRAGERLKRRGFERLKAETISFQMTQSSSLEAPTILSSSVLYANGVYLRHMDLIIRNEF